MGGSEGGGVSDRPHPLPPGDAELLSKALAGVGGGGVWDPKVCVPKMAQSDFPGFECRPFPRWSLWYWGGSRCGGVPPPSSCGVRPFYLSLGEGGGGET